MFTRFAKLFCVAALASTALAEIESSCASTVNSRVSDFTVQLKVLPTSSETTEVSLVIGAIACPLHLCEGPSSQLGTILYKGVFNAQSTDSQGNQYANISIPAPNWFNGFGQVNVARFYTQGAYNEPVSEYANNSILVTGSSG